MSARYFSNGHQPRQPADIHPSWCDCPECPTAWDAAHRRDFRAIWIGAGLALIAIAAIALANGQLAW
jgi:hypothetical protein